MKKLSAIVLLLFNLFLHLYGKALDPSFSNGEKLILNDVNPSEFSNFFNYITINIFL